MNGELIYELSKVAGSILGWACILFGAWKFWCWRNNRWRKHD